MRLWSLHPSYLDSKGLVALWREGLLAQKVLQGNTKGYKNHPQLQRFKNSEEPLSAIATFLHHIAQEADRRKFHFNASKIITSPNHPQIPVTEGQLQYELSHLLGKLQIRDQKQYRSVKDVIIIKVHPLFYTVDGKRESWEVVT